MDDRKILEIYPLPIARGYRRYLNATEVKERHDLGYFLFEIYLKYLASAVIAGYLAGEKRDHRVNAVLKGLLRRIAQDSDSRPTSSPGRHLRQVVG